MSFPLPVLSEQEVRVAGQIGLKMKSAGDRRGRPACACRGEYEEETQVTMVVACVYVKNEVESNQGVKLDNCHSRRDLTAS